MAARAAVAEAVTVVDAGRAEVAMCDTRLGTIADDLALVSSVTPPAGLDDLDADARRRRRSAGRGDIAVGEAREHRRVADAAAAAGPDVVAVSADLAARREAAARRRRARAYRRRAGDRRAHRRRRRGPQAAAARAEQERLDVDAERARERRALDPRSSRTLRHPSPSWTTG